VSVEPWCITRLTDNAVDHFQPAALAGSDAIGFFALELSVHTHITLNGLAVD